MVKPIASRKAVWRRVIIDAERARNEVGVSGLVDLEYKAAFDAHETLYERIERNTINEQFGERFVKRARAIDQLPAGARRALDLLEPYASRPAMAAIGLTRFGIVAGFGRQGEISADGARATGYKQLSGWEKFAKLKRTLDMFGMVRSKNQKLFHAAMIQTVLPLLFEHDLEQNLMAILKQFLIAEITQQALIVTPRREGKTVSVCMFAIACMVAIPNVEIAVFSTGRRASSKLLEQAYRLLCRLPGMKERVSKYNVETLWLRLDETGVMDERKMSSYPSSVKVSRARGARGRAGVPGRFLPKP